EPPTTPGVSGLSFGIAGGGVEPVSAVAGGGGAAGRAEDGGETTPADGGPSSSASTPTWPAPGPALGCGGSGAEVSCGAGAVASGAAGAVAASVDSFSTGAGIRST